jgi:predicted kinase
MVILICGKICSGKTTYAKNCIEKDTNTAHLSSDAIRKELYGDENIQGDGKKVFETAFHDMKEYGCLGENVVFDATNINRKRRMELVKEMRPYFDIIIFKWFSAPLSVCLARNKKRERQVPIDVLERMSANFDQPSIMLDEGWDYIEEIKNY